MTTGERIALVVAGLLAITGGAWIYSRRKGDEKLSGYPEKSSVKPEIIEEPKSYPKPRLNGGTPAPITTKTSQCIAPAMPTKSRFLQTVMLVRDKVDEAPKITSSADAAKVLEGQSDLPQENFVAVYLNNANTVLGTALIHRGTARETMVDPADVFRPGLLSGASRLLVAHNHPSSDVTPSPNDVAATRRLAKAGETLGIELLDHLVLGSKDQYASLRDMGLLGKG